MTILWDWNGTLLNDVPLCYTLINTMLTRHGYPALSSQEDYRNVFCFPIEAYYQKAGFDFARHPFRELAVEYMELYQPQSLACSLQADAVCALESLADVRHVVLSASRQDYLEQQIAHFGLTSYFDALLGIQDIYASSKVQAGKQWLAAHPDDAIMIGDSTHDFEVATALGAKAALYAGGHQAVEVLTNTGAPVFESLNAFAAQVKKGGFNDE